MKVGDTIREIESEFDVHHIEKDGLALWLDLRNRFFFKLLIGKESNLVIGSGLIFDLLATFFTGFIHWFGTYDVWVLNSDLNRVQIDGKAFDRLFDHPSKKLGKALFIESKLNKNLRGVPSWSEHVVSRSPLYAVEKLLTYFISTKGVDISVYRSILKKYGVEIDPTYSIKKMVASYRVMKLLLKVKRPPKTVFIAPSYTSYGYVKALKESGVTVVEGQHGVINTEHFGYNVYADFNRHYFPDYLLTFGEREQRVFQTPNRFIDAENVVAVGSYYIQYLRENHKATSYAGDHRLVFSVSLQDCDTGSKLIPFLIEVADKNPDILLRLKPRRTPIKTYLQQFTFPKNIEFVENADVYETILDSHVHITAYSSCALEAPALGRMNILVNLDNKAKDYYANILNNRTTQYVGTVEEFSVLIGSLQVPAEKEIMEAHSDVMCGDYTDRIDRFLRDKLC